MGEPLIDQLKHHTCLKGFWIKNIGPGELKLIKWPKMTKNKNKII